MKLLPTNFSVKWLPQNFFDDYARFYPSFCWVGKMAKGEAEQLTRWTTCREILTSNLRRDIVRKEDRICTDYTRLILKSSYSKESAALKYKGIFKDSHKAMETSMKILNILEKKAGWKPTTITKLERKTTTDINDVTLIVNKYIITGPKEWMRSTPLFSLYTLIIRSGWFRRFSKVKRVEDIISVCEKITSDPCDIDKIRQHQNHVRGSYNYWLLLILNEKELFGDRTPFIIYSKNHEYSGIAKLMSLSHDIDSTTRMRWTRLVKKYEDKISQGI